MKKDTRLTDRQQVIILDYFERSLGGETMEEVAKDYGVNRSTVSQWVNTFHGKQIQADWKKERTRDSIPKYFDVLEEKALSGSYKHMELYAKIFELMPSNKHEVVTEERTTASEVISKEELNDLFKSMEMNSPNRQIKRIK